MLRAEPSAVEEDAYGAGLRAELESAHRRAYAEQLAVVVELQRANRHLKGRLEVGRWCAKSSLAAAAKGQFTAWNTTMLADKKHRLARSGAREFTPG